VLARMLRLHLNRSFRSPAEVTITGPSTSAPVVMDTAKNWAPSQGLQVNLGKRFHLEAEQATAPTVSSSLRQPWGQHGIPSPIPYPPLPLSHRGLLPPSPNPFARQLPLKAGHGQSSPSCHPQRRPRTPPTKKPAHKSIWHLSNLLRKSRRSGLECPCKRLL